MSCRTVAIALVLVVVVVSGCGSDYEREASALCRSFNEAAFAEHVDIQRARTLYARLGDGLARLTPPIDLRRTHDVLIGFARGGEQLFAGVADPDKEPKVNLRMTVGDWEDDVPQVQRGLPDCADSLTGTHPEIQVIR